MLLLFKPIPNFSNYLIDKNANIYSLFTRKYLIPSSNNAYLNIGLINDNEQKKRMYIHRLLAITFLDNPDNKPCIDHIDRNTRNNNLENLRWCTSKENRRNSRRQTNNKLGYKHICEDNFKNSHRYRLTIKSHNISLSFNKKNFNISQVIQHRNTLLNSLNLPITD